MSNYFIYRINTSYDGFTPEKIPERINNKKFQYNWGAYLEAVDKNDIVLTYFTGSCRPGIYLISRVIATSIGKREANVEGKVIAYNPQKPLVDRSRNKTLFEKLWVRPRGAELVVPESAERQIFELIKEYAPYVILPGSPEFPTLNLSDVPRIDLTQDISSYLARFKIIGTFWIRPSQASWIASAPNWLSYITGSFSKFKGGDPSNVESFAVALSDQIIAHYKPTGRYFSAICSVPLNEAKKKAGEYDRVRELAVRVAGRIGVPYKPLFELAGNVSRRLYKLTGLAESCFKEDYLANLRIKETRPFIEAINEGKMLLLVDDVFTDGVTTRTIVEGCRNAVNDNRLEFVVATLGIMTKKRNMAARVYENWEN